VLAEMLVRFEMPEAAPLVLGEALGPEPSPVALGGVLGALRDALGREVDVGTPTTARRIFQAAERLLALADRETYRGKLDPSAAELRHLMAGIEIRSGQVDAARPLLLAALKEEPTVAGYTMLAMLERQVGNEEVALGHARHALELPAAELRVPGSAHELDAAEANLLLYELARDRGEKAKAQDSIARARQLVDETLQGRLAPVARVRAERLLARILDASGDRVGGAQALDRALTAAATDSPLLGPAMIGTIARALVVRDLTQARATLQQGIDADVDEEDLVYGALWLGFLEQTLREVPDGKVERVLGRAALGTSWTSKLARWARGKIDDAGLRAGARSYSEKVEAEFYLAMKAKIAGDPRAGAALARVAQNPLIELMEVDLARELLVAAGQPPRPMPSSP
jgi:tetratricopeptide (TPR) repeat protein